MIMLLHSHLHVGYCRSFCDAGGLLIRGCYEPCLTDESEVTPAVECLPGANRAAWVGLPSVLIWGLQKN